MTRALITGISGQDGSYLTELLLEKGYEVDGTMHQGGELPWYFDAARSDERVAKRFRVHVIDLEDTTALAAFLQKVRPDEIYNFAAQSYVGLSFQQPEHTANVTGMGAVRLLEALRLSGIPARFYQAGSSELFGKAVVSPQNERTPFNPCSPYASAKAFAFYMTRNYREAYRMYAVNGILFNHESSRRGENFVTKKIVSTLVKISSGSEEQLLLGNLDVKRDWGYAKEYVEGMWKMLQQPAPDDYVLATGRAASVREFLELCLRHVHIPFEREGEGVREVYRESTTGRMIVGIDPRLFRPNDLECLTGDAAKAKRALGWEPRTTLADLTEIMVREEYKLQGKRYP